MSKPEDAKFATALKHYEALIATHPEAERKGAAMPYTSLNGHMFSFLTKRGSWPSGCRSRSGMACRWQTWIPENCFLMIGSQECASIVESRQIPVITVVETCPRQPPWGWMIQPA